MIVRIATLDANAVDLIGNRIQGLRAYIRTLPHQGALTDIDTLLAVAETDARSLSNQLAASPAGIDTIGVDKVGQDLTGPNETHLGANTDRRPDEAV